LAAITDIPEVVSLAIAGTRTGVWDYDVERNEVRYSSGWCEILGYRPEDISTALEESFSRVHPDDLDYVKARMNLHLYGESDHFEVEHRLRCKDNTYKFVLSRGRVVKRDDAGAPLRVIGTTADITSVRELSERLQDTCKLLTNLVNQVPGFVFQYRRQPNGAEEFAYASDAIQQIFELSKQDIAANAGLIRQRIHPDDLPVFEATRALSAAKMTPWHVEFRVRLPDQGLRWRQLDAQPMPTGDGDVLWHGLVVDATDRKQAESELQKLARIDYLTQLPNRRFFMEKLAAELSRLHRAGNGRATVMMLDLDHFKTINDSFGHAVGDIVIMKFGRLLREEVRRHDAAGRLGGEEFGVILSGTGLAEARLFANRLRRRIAEQPVVANDHSIAFTISVGISEMTASDSSVEAVLARADAALYRAKRQGRDRVVEHAEPLRAMTVV
jgi:diguanylate cyclase (GGDEF)-like protein/PAS domain S-box-containing protein